MTIKIPEILRRDEFRFILVDKESKKPIEKEWTTINNYKYDDKKLLEYLDKNGNYGILCNNGNLGVLDIDDINILEEVRKILPPTLEITTGSGKKHFYYLTPPNTNKIILDKEGKHLGELQSGNVMVVGPNSIHPKTKKEYIIEKELPITQLTIIDILKIKERFTNNKNVEEDNDAKKDQKSNNSINWDKEWNKENSDNFNNLSDSIKITDLVSLSSLKKIGNEYCGSHPVHGSETGMNFFVNTYKNLCYCFRHSIAYNPLSFLALKEGIISCGEKLRGDKFIEVIKIAKEKYNYKDINNEFEEKKKKEAEKLIEDKKNGTIKDVKKDDVNREKDKDKDEDIKENVSEEEIDFVVNNTIEIINNNKLKWEDIKNIIKDRFYKLNKLQLTINSSFSLQGKVINKLYDDVKNITVACVVEEKRTDPLSGKKETYDRLMCIDDFPELKRKKVVYSLKFNFYMYIFHSQNKKYLLLSREEIDDDLCNVEGLCIDLKDKLSVGEQSFLPIDTPIILVSKVQPLVSKFNTLKDLNDEMSSYNITHDKLFNWLFSRRDGFSYRHPKIFEEFLISFLFSSLRSFDEYPVHLLLVGPQGTGKSWMSESIHEKISEDIEIVEGSGSNTKSLVPSFKNSPPDSGKFLQAKRVLFVDEFFRLLLRTRPEDRNNILTTLNPLLEHKTRVFGSGNGTVRARSTAKLFATTNPVYGHNSIQDLISNIDNSFLARLLIFNQSKKHLKFIRENSGLGEEINNDFKFNSINLIAIMDFFTKQKSSFDLKRVFEIYKTYQTHLPQTLEDLYSNRYKHHIKCIMDGVIKYRCLLDKSSQLSAKDEDYEKLNEIWRELISGWTDIDLTRLSREERVKYLTSFEVFVYEEFYKFNEIYEYQIEKLFENKAPISLVRKALDTLRDLGLIDKDGHKYFLIKNENKL